MCLRKQPPGEGDDRPHNMRSGRPLDGASDRDGEEQPRAGNPRRSAGKVHTKPRAPSPWAGSGRSTERFQNPRGDEVATRALELVARVASAHFDIEYWQDGLRVESRVLQLVGLDARGIGASD